jgi:hypothetical protein
MPHHLLRPPVIWPRIKAYWHRSLAAIRVAHRIALVACFEYSRPVKIAYDTTYCAGWLLG